MPTTKASSSRTSRGVRLFKAAREFNVSADTLVETLKKEGMELDAKLAAADINAKLSPEMYDVLLSTYSDDREAAQRVARLRQQQHAEDEAPEPVAAPEPEPKPAPQKQAAPKPGPEPVEPEPEPEPAPQPVAEEAPAPEPEPAAEPEPEPVAEQVPSPESVVEAPAPEPEPAAEKAEKEEAPAPPTASEPAPEPQAEKPDAEAPKAETPAAAAEGAEPDEADEEVADEKKEDDLPEGTLKGDRYSLSGTKVVGKIDLSSIDLGQRGRRKRKRKNEPSEGDKPAARPGDAAPPASSGGGRDRGRKKGRKGRGREVDQNQVDETLAKTLQSVNEGSKRGRQKRRRAARAERAAERQEQMERMEEQAGILRVMEFVSTAELAELMAVSVTEVIQKGFGLGMMISINQRLDADSITLIADEFGRDVEFISDLQEVAVDIAEDTEDQLEWRAPVVTIMGHVDHGKTSLLDYIREENVVAGEAGGITQHIGAYKVNVAGDRPITFLDTPGHEAFTAMRARGAQVTDLVILVVAADDQVMPQTIEAISHSKAAGVPIIVALNKIDRDTAQPERIMQQLSENGVLVEQYGGKVQCEFVSAKTGQGVDDLLEKVLLESELLDLQANPNREALGAVIETQLDKGRGVVATVLVQNGTLKIGDPFVAGTNSGRVRAMFNERDQRVEEAGPSTPVQILGFAGSPAVGDRFIVRADEREARDIASKRQQLQREQMMHARKHVSLADLSRRMALGELQELNLIIKADASGSVEALSDALLKLSTDEVAVSIVHSGVGAINESDVTLAAASNAIIIGFQVRPMSGTRQLAEQEEIDIRTYSIIYDAIEEVRDALEGMLSPEETEKVNGSAEVRDTFRIPRAGTIAGCYVLDGKIQRNDKVRLIRDGVVVYDGELGSLRRFKDDVKEVSAGYECGLNIDGFNDIKVGDQVEAYTIVETARTLA
jgi:translation initiation factor IF-2